MKRLDLLKQVSFGVQVAEEEVKALASYFVETNEWIRIARGEIDIIRRPGETTGIRKPPWG